MMFVLWSGFVIVVAAAALYLLRRWAEAKRLRDFAFATKPGAGITEGERKPSALPYLFK